MMKQHACAANAVSRLAKASSSDGIDSKALLILGANNALEENRARERRGLEESDKEGPLGGVKSFDSDIVLEERN